MGTVYVDGSNRFILGSGAGVAVDGANRSVLVTGSGVRLAGLVRETLGGQRSPTYISKVVREILVTSPSLGVYPLFPAIPEGYPINIGIIMDTTIGTTKSLREVRIPQQTYPLWDIEIPLPEMLDQTLNATPYTPFAGYQQFQEALGLFLQMYGQTGVFAFTCPWDYSRSNQAIGTGDGYNKTFTIFRTWSSGTTASAAPIGAVNTMTSVYLNGTAQSPSSYTVNRDSISFVSAPGSGVAITATFSFYYLCRFVEDEQNFEQFFYNRWTVPGLKFQAVIWS